MKEFALSSFSDNTVFPFHIMYDRHEDTFPIHRHLDFSELVVVMNGTATHIVDNERFTVKKGDVFVIGKETSHGFTDASAFEICNIMFRSESTFLADMDIKKSPGFHSLFVIEPYLTTVHGFSNRLTLSPDDYLQVYELLKTMNDEYNSDRDGRITMLRSYFSMLTVILSRLNNTESDDARRNIINVANTAAFIERHYTERLTLDELAEMSHYSARHFVRIFTETYHTTPQKYIISLRLKYACNLLRDTELSIEDTALRSGFSDGNYFSRIFKQHIGVTPKQYRKQQREI